jgi:hypothetical protein
MSERLILPNRPEKISIIDSSGTEIEVNSEDVWMYKPDAFRSTDEDVRIVMPNDLPRNEWMRQGENDE